jgi:hypothetical protein
MEFVNKYIEDADFERFQLRRIIGDENPFQPGYLFARDWTIDRQQEVFLVKIWTHREAEFDGWAFYWKGEWIFFEMRLNGVGKNTTTGELDWVGYLVRNFKLPMSLTPVREEVVDSFEQALAVYCGAGVFSSCSPCTAKVDYTQSAGEN